MKSQEIARNRKESQESCDSYFAVYWYLWAVSLASRLNNRRIAVI